MKARPSSLLIIAVLGLLFVSPVAANGNCNTPGNLTFNCNFDRFVGDSEGRLVAEGWSAWVLMGSPAFGIDDHGSAPGAPAQWIWSDGGVWTAGLYQHVPVTPGKWYEAKIDWAAPSVRDIERKVGIDPTGGVDPASPSIVWSESSWEEVRMPNLRVSAFAPGPTVTVFVWTHHGVSYGQDQVFLDAVTLVENPNLAPPTPKPSPTPTPKPTRKPPTRTPTSVPVTETSTQSPVSSTPVETPTPLPTPTLAPPTETPTPTLTFTPTPLPPTRTPTPTWTPTITPVPVAQLIRTPPPKPALGGQGPASPSLPDESLLLYVAVGAVVVSLLLVVAVIGLWVISRKPATGE